MSSHVAGSPLSKSKLAASILSAAGGTPPDASREHDPPGVARHGKRSAVKASDNGTSVSLTSVRSPRAARGAAADSSSGTLVDMAKALVARKRTPTRSRNITLRLTGNSLDFFEILEAKMGATPSDVFRDGLWIGLVAAERYVKRGPISLVLRSGEDSAESDILDRGFLNTVERFASVNRVWKGRKASSAAAASKNKAGATFPGS